MIEVNITGQLGNQLFQYACARQLQEIYGGKIVLNTYELCHKMPHFKLSLDDFILNQDVVIENKKPLSKVNAEQFFVKVMRKFFPNLYFSINAKRGIFIWGYSRIYKEIPRLKPSRRANIVLNGFWQSENYFENISEILRKELQPKYPPIERNKELYEKIKDTISVCVSIRRGDFLSPQHIKTFYVCDEDYFSRAMDRIKELLPKCTFFAFSDDIAWVKDNVKFPGVVYYESGNDPVWEKLRLMSSCKHFILSNSSFSWWVQYLSNNEKKIVVAPDRWYNSGKNVRAAIYSNDWEIINANRNVKSRDDMCRDSVI